LASVWPFFFLALLTAFVLQILSHLANDYGDFVKGTDNDKRIGPQRALQSGLISQSEMKRALIICGTLTFALGISLILMAFGPEQMLQALGMLALGLAAIWAAIRYTVGKRPYGYAGLGDVFVVCFFGLVSILGVSFLYLGEINSALVLPALSYGFLAAGVLNINNMRDIDNDRDSNKRTLVVIMGAQNARFYHAGLILLAFLCQFIYLWNLNLGACFSPFADAPDLRLRFTALAGFLPVFVNSMKVLLPKQNPAEYNPFLKGLSLTSLGQVLIFVWVLQSLIP